MCTLVEGEGAQPGGLVGYAVGQDACYGSQSRLVYCTTGWLLSWMAPRVGGTDDEGAPASSQPIPFTHIILDEVHERSVDADFLSLLFYKAPAEFLPPSLRILVMSATLESNIGDYIQGRFAGGKKGRRKKPAAVPTLHVGNEKRFPVRTVYLDELAHECAGVSDRLTYTAAAALTVFGSSGGKNMQVKLEKKMASFVARACSEFLQDPENETKGSALVFVPGQRQSLSSQVRISSCGPRPQ